MWNQLKHMSNYVVIEIKDGCCERFINLCRFNEICMWDIQRMDDKVVAKIKKKDFMKIRQYVRKSQVHIKIIKKVGIGFIAFRYRKHYSFLLGIFISLVIIKVLSLYVWNISFTGNTEYTDQMLTRFLNSYHYRMGMKISDIRCDDIESELRSSFEDITWVSAQISGTRLIVHIKENDGFTEKVKADGQTPQSIYADCEGTIVSMVTRKGTPLVKTGDLVSVGDELVSSIVEYHNDAGEVIQSENVCTDADIVIRTALTYEDSMNRIQQKKIYTGRTKTKQMIGIPEHFLEYGLSLSKLGDYDIVTEKENWKLGSDFYLPVWSGKRIYYEYIYEPVKLTDEELEEQLTERLHSYLSDLEENGVQIRSNRVNMKSEENSCIMEGIIEADVTEGSRKD